VKDATIGRNSPIATGRTDDAQHAPERPVWHVVGQTTEVSRNRDPPRLPDPALARRVPIGSYAP
jgi:hypothetical protein